MGKMTFSLEQIVLNPSLDIFLQLLFLFSGKLEFSVEPF